MINFLKSKKFKIFFLLFLFSPSIYLLLILFGMKNSFIFYSKSDSLFKGFAIKTINQNINSGDCVLFKNPNKNITIHKSDFLIKKVQYEENNKLYVIGRTKEELYKQYKIKDLQSYDSKFFGLIDKNECIKVKELKITNYILKLINVI